MTDSTENALKDVVAEEITQSVGRLLNVISSFVEISGAIPRQLGGCPNQFRPRCLLASLAQKSNTDAYKYGQEYIVVYVASQCDK